ncbi:MAG TPA: nitrilase-related carbon-nitrogen hydrolase [Deinococcales bacterium]|nr:nitrilase-related carbon-nitrogen hydrolase [Deinococcales bacterium]
MNRARLVPWLALIAGAALYSLIGWKWNVAAAAWLAPALLVFHFRRQSRWYATLPAVALLWAVSYVNKVGSWDMDPMFEVLALGLATLPLVTALYLDRYAARRLPTLPGTLVFPAAFVGADYLFAMLPFGTVFSIAVTQVYLTPLVQVAAITGIWGIGFLVLWTAPVMNAWMEAGFDVRPVRAPLLALAGSAAAMLVLGGLRVALDRPTSPTVRVAGVTVPHPRDYWAEVIDLGTPRDKAAALAGEFASLTDQLFEESARAARAGAKVVFWSEANAFLLPEAKDAFLQRAREFAREHGIYLVPAYQVLRYGDTSGFNALAMIAPDGRLAFEYEKTMSWYATTSDGQLRSISTPFGRLSAVICFDMDFPALIRQAASQGVDIMLVPAFDTYATRVYHSEVGLLRAVENGFSMVRMVNEGASLAADYRGNILAYQDHFTTESRVMTADVPTRGVSTLYGRLGDWLAWLCLALTAVTVTAAARPARSRLAPRPQAA